MQVKRWSHLIREDQDLLIGKIMQYTMLLILFGTVFFLPGYLSWKGQDSQGQSVSAPAAENKGVILLDPGHGGDDPGMIGAGDVKEKVLNLLFAQKIGKLLEKAGYQVVYTRETDEGLYDPEEKNKKAQDMQRRVARIREEKPLVSVSIHQNSYPQDESVSGPQVFYYTHSAEGEKLAKSIQNKMNECLQISHPRVPKGNTSYYILKRSESTTVIVECGFLTNPKERDLLMQENYQEQLSEAVCEGICDYLKK